MRSLFWCGSRDILRRNYGGSWPAFCSNSIPIDQLPATREIVAQFGMPERAVKSTVEQPLPRQGVFATTRWTLVLNANADSEEGREALETLCRVYWFPVYALVRRHGFDPESSRDFTQSFFLHVLSRNSLGNARRDRGRFRSYLAQSVKNFLADEWDKARAQKRGCGLTAVSIDSEQAEGRYLEAQPGLTPDRLFDRQWAEEVIAAARARLVSELQAADKSSLLEVLDGLGEPGALSLTEQAERLGMPLNTLKSHLRRARLRQAEIIRELIAETVASPKEVEAELRELLAAISG
jgi:DNA-directed RNA polymerase specialized sigma24 family protein